MAALNAQAPSPAGVAPTYNAVSASDTVPNAGSKTILLVRNGGAGAVNVTLVGRGKMADVVVPNRVINIPAGADRLIDPLAGLYNDADGRVTVNFDVIASVTMAVIYLP